MVCKTAPTSPAVRSVSEQGDHAQDTADYETALDCVGYGRFSRSALCACAGAFFATGVQNCVMAYVLPAARCDLRLSTYQVGLVNMAFMCGGVASAFFWGVVGDVAGRRRTLAGTLLADAALTLAQSSVRDLRWLLLARGLNGFLIGGPSTLTFTYLSDLVGARRRQLYLAITGMSFVAAWLVLPAVAWLIIPLKLGPATAPPLSSWRLLLGLSGAPALAAGAWAATLPESPRALAAAGRGAAALRVLADMHRRNTGNNDFKIKKLIQDNIFVAKTLGEDPSRTKALFIGVLKDLRTLVSRAYAVKSSLILFAFFANMAAGFGLNLWIPALLQRVQGPACSAGAGAGVGAGSAAEAGAGAGARLSNGTRPGARGLLAEPGECNGDISDEVFTSGLIVGACCVLGNAACALVCRGGARGVRAAAAACAAACAAAAAVLAAAACGTGGEGEGGAAAVPAAAALTAASLNGNVLLIRLLLHALPPRLSALGVCWGAWWGRAGGVASNVAVGALLDLSCAAPFLAVAALLALSIGAIMLIKLEEQTEASPEEDGVEKNSSLDRHISTHM